MGNPYRGQVEFEAGGKQHVLRLDFDCFCRVEQDLLAQAQAGAPFEGITIPKQGMDVRGFIARLILERGRLTNLCFLFARGLGISPDEAKELIMEIGLDQASVLVNAALEWAMPTRPKTPRAPEGKANPSAGTT